MSYTRRISVSVDTPLTILGHTFHGLSDIKDHVKMYSTMGNINDVIDKPSVGTFIPRKESVDIHVALIFKRFPCFDSFDFAYEDRFFDNYFFSRKPFTLDEIYMLAALDYGVYNCPEPEQVPCQFAHVFHMAHDKEMEVTL